MSLGVSPYEELDAGSLQRCTQGWSRGRHVLRHDHRVRTAPKASRGFPCLPQHLGKRWDVIQGGELCPVERGTEGAHGKQRHGRKSELSRIVDANGLMMRYRKRAVGFEKHLFRHRDAQMMVTPEVRQRIVHILPWIVLRILTG
jgi:hypothetical protein